MSYYIETSGTHGKAQEIADKYKGEIVEKDIAFAAMSEPNKGVIVVVNNGMFEAAAFAYNLDEWDAFHMPTDYRPKQYVVMGRKRAREQSGFSGP